MPTSTISYFVVLPMLTLSFLSFGGGLGRGLGLVLVFYITTAIVILGNENGAGSGWIGTWGG